MKTISTQQDVSHGLDQLKKLDPRLIPVIDNIPEVALRNQINGFPGLVRIIIGQHVSTASASAIHNRFIQAITPVSPQAYLEACEEILIKIGLTRAKQNTITNVANAILSGELDLTELSSLSEKDAITKLTSLKGIGPWTAEVYLLFCEGHPDILAAGDLAIREAVRHAFQMEQRPSEKELRHMSVKWSPYRGIASRLFWSYYANIKGANKGQPL